MKYRPRDTKRAAKIAYLRAKGWTLARIGERFGISRQRVEQILNPEPQRTRRRRADQRAKRRRAT